MCTGRSVTGACVIANDGVVLGPTPSSVWGMGILRHMRTPDTDTAVSTETRLKPLAQALFIVCSSLDAYLLAVSMGPLGIGGWLALALPCLALVALNLRFYHTNGPSIGMMPLAVFSLVPATIGGLLTFVPGSVGWWLCALGCALSTAVLCVFLYWFVRIRKAYQAEPHIAPDAVLVVLGGLVRNGKPVLTLVKRLEVAARLWHEAPTRTIVVTGGPTTDRTSTEADTMAAWLVDDAQVSESAILREREAINTEQNFLLSKQLVEREGLSDRQLCVISSNYHLYRAGILAKRLELEVTLVPAPVPLKSRAQQWCREVLTILSKLR